MFPHKIHVLRTSVSSLSKMPRPTGWQMLMSILVCTTVLVASGCKTTETHHNPPPVGLRPAPVALDQLDQLIDSSTQYLATNLPIVSEIQQAEHQQVLMIGPIEDRTFSDRSRFASAMESIIRRIRTNKAIAESFVVLTTQHRDANRVIDSVSSTDRSQFDDPFGDGKNRTEKVQYHPNSIYLLTGHFYQATQGTGRSYRLFVEVVHARSGRSILSHEMARRLRWDTNTGRWVTIN